MIYIKKHNEIAIMRKAGELLNQIFKTVPSILKEGLSSKEIDSFFEQEMIKRGLFPVTKGYKGYKFATCISINSDVVHGVPSQKKILQKGDLVKIDAVAALDGWCVDMARGYFVEEAKNEKDLKLQKVAEEAFQEALKVAKPGNFVYDISRTVQDFVEKQGFYVVREFAGHGIGKNLHEEPEVPNFLSAFSRPVKLVPGMTLAIEPMVLASPDRVLIDKNDGWTAFSSKGVLAGHYEDTIVITEFGNEVLTNV